MTAATLKFKEHYDRLGNIAWLVRLLDGAIVRTAKTLPVEPRFLMVQEDMVKGFYSNALCSRVRGWRHSSVFERKRCTA